MGMPYTSVNPTLKGRARRGQESPTLCGALGMAVPWSDAVCASLQGVDRVAGTLLKGRATRRQGSPTLRGEVGMASPWSDAVNASRNSKSDPSFCGEAANGAGGDGPEPGGCRCGTAQVSHRPLPVAQSPDHWCARLLRCANERVPGEVARMRDGSAWGRRAAMHGDAARVVRSRESEGCRFLWRVPLHRCAAYLLE